MSQFKERLKNIPDDQLNLPFNIVDKTKAITFQPQNIKKKNLEYDTSTQIEHIPEEELFDNLSQLKVECLNVLRKHLNKMILNDNREKFNNSLLKYENYNILHKNFTEEAVVKDEVSEATQSRIERFRYDTSAKHGRSIDSSKILSNISLQEVFENTAQKTLINKTSNILNFDKNFNIILEEESNLNLNTFTYNFRTNLNENFNLDLDDRNIVPEEEAHEGAFKIDEELKDYINE
jgi:hypothetical protein